MSPARPAVTAVTTGTRIVYDGEAWTVAGIEAGRLLLTSALGRSLLADTAAVLADPSAVVLPGAGGGGEPAACGPLLDSLPAADRGELAVRLRHLREVLTGYASGTPAAAGPGEPRPEFDPSLPLLDRYEAKAAELGVSRRTVQRWAAALQESGPAGVADGRSQRAADPLGGVDERWLAMCRLVLAEHTEASRPTRDLVLRRISARLAAGHGEGTVPEPGRRRAYAVLAELARGTNAFTGSTKGKRSIAARPQGVYGRLRPARPGEFLLLDTTPLDVFAMEPVTLRWVRCELTGLWTCTHGASPGCGCRQYRQSQWTRHWCCLRHFGRGRGSTPAAGCCPMPGCRTWWSPGTGPPGWPGSPRRPSWSTTGGSTCPITC